MSKLICPYCHGTADLNDTANSDFQVNIDMSDKNYPTLWVEFNSFYYCSMSIDYCPMCGRKLVTE